MTYPRDDSIDLEAWKERVGAKTWKVRATISTVVEVVENAGLKGFEKAKIVEVAPRGPLRSVFRG